MPSTDQHIGLQFVVSLKEFFSHREAWFSVLIIVFTAAGFMVLITGSAALVIEIYGYPVAWFGAILDRRLIRLADAIITVTDEISSSYASCSGPDLPILTATNGVEYREFIRASVSGGDG